MYITFSSAFKINNYYATKFVQWTPKTSPRKRKVKEVSKILTLNIHIYFKITSIVEKSTKILSSIFSPNVYERTTQIK